MSVDTMDVYERVKELDHHDKCCILAMGYSFENAHATEDDISWLRNELTQDLWRAHIALLETEAAEEPHMAASVNRAIQFIRERILTKSCEQAIM